MFSCERREELKCVVMVLNDYLQCITYCWHCFDVLSNTLALPLFMGTRFIPKPNQCIIAVVDVEVRLRIGVGVVHHRTPPLMDG